ncbi:anthrone oxygenase family protein [Streptomyces sp. NPDC054995]
MARARRGAGTAGPARIGTAPVRARPLENASCEPASQAMMPAMTSLLLVLATIVTGLGEHDEGAGPAILAALICSVVGHLITVLGNIPFNNALAASEGGDDSAARAAFESRWNTLHRVRTVLSLAAFVLLVVAL